jgi:hypothetical protein
VGVAVGGGGSVPVGRGESRGDSKGSSGDWKASGVAEAVAEAEAEAAGVVEAVAVGEPVGVLLGSGGRSVWAGDGEAGSPSTEVPQAERMAANAAAPAPFRNRRRSSTICDFNMVPL